MGKEKQEFLQFTVRLPLPEGRRFEELAHTARLPTGVFMRQLLLSGQLPKAAPPTPADLSFDAGLLLKTFFGLVSNLTQIEVHASRIAGPLDQLVGPDKALQRMSKQAQSLGLNVKSGSLNEVVIKQILTDLDPASRAMNDRLARPLNEGKALPLEVWKQVLTDLQAALPSDGIKVKQ